VGCDRKVFRKKLLGADTKDALDSVSPARVALLIGALTAIVLGRSPRGTARNVARLGALERWTFIVGRSGSFFARLTGTG
jgi:hypothetical protein